MITLRPYQEEQLQALWSYFMTKKGNPILAAPTGTGKSLVPAEFIRRTMFHYNTQRFLMTTHVKELIAQNYEKLQQIWPNAPAGIYSAGLKRRDIMQPIIYGGIQSMYKVPEFFGHRDIIFIDEAHLVSQDDASMYLRFIAALKKINPYLKIIGMSATAYRIGQGMITDGGLFTDVAHNLTSLESFNSLIADGYLAPLIPKKTVTELDVSNVQIQKGEFVASQLQHEVDKAHITWAGLQELCYYGQNRRSWLLFATGIEHANHIAEMLTQLGIDCASVHSKQKPEYNDNAIKAFKNYSLRAIVNYGKLTTGFDHPGIDLIGMFRPTMSVALWVQMLGRGTRPEIGKQNCIAKGSLVLTQNGLIPIEKITLNDKVWDGESFVSHDGLIYKGFKEVIHYEGLSATPEHRVYTEKGWQTFRECFKKRIGIALTEYGGDAIQLSENYFSGNSISKAFLRSSSMRKLRANFLQRFYKFNQWQSWLPQMWKFKWRFAKMVDKTMLDGKTTLYQFKKQSLYELWWPWNKIQFQFTASNGYVGEREFRSTKRFEYRPKRQQWALRSWQLKIFNKFRKHVEPQISKKHVFDITNAGKHNRFTVNGLLVHNCLVLDFAKNTMRLGPINDPVIPRKKGDKIGELPIKICEACGVYNHISARTCDACGHPFSFEVKITAKAGNEELIKDAEALKIETFDVTYVTYAKKQKIDKPAYIQVTYFCGMNDFREFIFPENNKFRRPFHDWWMMRHSSDPPKSTEEALRFISELRKPKRIRVHVNKMVGGRNWPEVLSAEF